MRASSPGKGRPPGSSSKSHGHGHGIPGSKPMIDGSSSTKRDHSISGKVGMVAANGNPHQNLVEEIMETGVHESLNHENGRHQEFREEADHMEIVVSDLLETEKGKSQKCRKESVIMGLHGDV
ncbi:hypothetical protein ACOSP7_031323 [Xanthoceras sorbifolium]